MSQFSAAAQAIGYLHQVRYALVTLLENEECCLRLEALDDIDVDGSDGGKKLLQLKHRAEGSSLNDYSSDLWKTIRVWATQIKEGTIDLSSSIFNLITTSIADENTAASYLRSDKDRDPVKALELLKKACADSTNVDLLKSFNAFFGLTESQKDQLVARIFVQDGSPNILQSRERIERLLAISVAREHRAMHADSIEGWWLRVSVEMLSNKRGPISGAEVFDKVVALSQQFQPGSLPTDCYQLVPTEEEKNSLYRHDFVGQLRKIDIPHARIQYAVLDYHRAFTQRSRWVRDRLLVDDDLDIYADHLLEEWNRMRLVLEQKMAPDESDMALIKIGQGLLEWAEMEADIRIRPNVTEAYVMRGSFHMLADEVPPRIKWHRNYGAIIKSAIEGQAR